MEFLNANAGSIQALATVALVLITGVYVVLIGKQSKAAEASARAGERSLQLLSAEQRAQAIEWLHILRQKMLAFRRISEDEAEKFSREGSGNPGRLGSGYELYDPSHWSDWRGQAVQIGGGAGESVIAALQQADKVNKRINDFRRIQQGDRTGDEMKAREAVADALEKAEERFSKATQATDRALVELQDESVVSRGLMGEKI